MSKRFSIIGDIVANIHGEDITPGGAGAIALALRDLGGEVTLRSALGNDDAGNAVAAQLKAARIHPGKTDRVDEPTATATWDDAGAITGRTAGSGIGRHARMDIYDLFSHDTAIIASFDQPLRRFLSDLPAHTVNNVRMVTTLDHLDVTTPSDDEVEIAMRFDVIVGTESQLCTLMEQDNATDALGELFDRMHTTSLRAAVAITDHGIEIISREDRVLRPVQDAVPAALLPKVVAGAAWGLANRLEWDSAATIMADPSAVID